MDARLEIVNYKTAPDLVQVSPGVTGVELNNPAEFQDGTNPISISRLTMGPGDFFDRHVHPWNHVLTILEGSGFVIYDRDGEDDKLDFSEGDVFNVPGTIVHAVNAGPTGLTMLSIGSPAMRLIDPGRMVFTDSALNDRRFPRLLEASFQVTPDMITC